MVLHYGSWQTLGILWCLQSGWVHYQLFWEPTRFVQVQLFDYGVWSQEDNILLGHINYRKLEGHKMYCMCVKFKKCFNILTNHTKSEPVLNMALKVQDFIISISVSLSEDFFFFRTLRLSSLFVLFFKWLCKMNSPKAHFNSGKLVWPIYEVMFRSFERKCNG